MTAAFVAQNVFQELGIPTAWYYYRLREDDFVSEFCVANAKDHDQTVETLAPDGSAQLWARRWEGDLLVFHPPDGYAGNQGLVWRYDKRFQRHEPAPREVMEREALRNRVTA